MGWGRDEWATQRRHPHDEKYTSFFFFRSHTHSTDNGFDGTPEESSTACLRLPHSTGAGTGDGGCEASPRNRSYGWPGGLSPYPRLATVCCQGDGMSERASRRSRNNCRLPIQVGATLETSRQFATCSPMPCTHYNVCDWGRFERTIGQESPGGGGVGLLARSVHRGRWTLITTTPAPRAPASIGTSAVKSREDAGAKPGLFFKPDAGRVTRIPGC